MIRASELPIPAAVRIFPARYRRVLTSTLKALFLSLAFSTAALGQEYSVHSYSSRDGLPNNLTKFCFQDDVGFLWIATDGGLVRFDGVKFKTYSTGDGLPSNYVKSLFSDGNGNNFVVTDLGVVRMRVDRSSVRFTPFAEAGTMQSDSMLFYPKSMYQDRSGTLWIADALGVSQNRDNSIKKYAFPPETWPDSFVRTFQMFEDEWNHLLVVAERGQLFIYNRSADTFQPLPPPSEVLQANAVLPRTDGSIWLGNAFGLFSFRMNEHGAIAEWNRIGDIEQVLSLLDGGNGRVFVGTASSGLYVLSEADDFQVARPFVRLNSQVINHLTKDDEGNIIASTDNGFAIIRPNFFTSELAATNTAIQAVAVDPRGNVYSVIEEDYYRLSYEDGRISRQLVFSTDEGLTALASDGVRHWAGSRNGSIYLKRPDQQQKISLRGEQAVASMTTDDNGSLWATGFKRTEVVRVAPNGTVTYYGPEEGVVSPINVVQNIEGNVYAGGDGDAYLFKYVPALDRFVDISLPLGFVPEGTVEVYDLHIGVDGNFWLASSEGLLVFGVGRLERYAPRILESEEVRAIAHDAFGSLWIGTGRGLYRLNRGQITHFNRDLGLANLTMNHRSIAIDKEERPWVGHYSGVSAWSRTVGEILTTPRPVSIGLSVDGEPQDPDVGDIAYGSFVEVNFIALSFPGENIHYQTRLAFPGTEWSQARPESFLRIPRVAEGTYTVQVRAQQDGYAWSQPTDITFTIALPWYREGWAAIVYFVGGFGILGLVMIAHDRIRTSQLRSRNETLELLVKKRTRELIDQTKTIEQANMELKEALEQNHEFIGIAAHDLRNPLTSLIGFSELLLDSTDRMDELEFKSKSQDILPIIHRAASSMQGVIQDVLDSQMVDRGANKLALEDTDISEIARAVINLNSTAARRKGITVHFNPKGIYHARCDARSMQRVLDNLLSNAIKYSPPSSSVFVSLSFVERALRISIRDEGPGLTEEDRRRVFGKLQRLSAKPTGGEHSTGLGLYIVKSIVEMHEGKVGVESEPGEGADFWIELPVERVRVAA